LVPPSGSLVAKFAIINVPDADASLRGPALFGQTGLTPVVIADCEAVGLSGPRECQDDSDDS